MDRVEIHLADASLAPDGARVGVLERGERGAPARFSYAAEWLEAAHRFPLEPGLPLTAGSFYPDEGALHRIFLDMAPDRWGRMLMERRERLEAEASSRRARTLRDWDFLTGVNDATRVGGLRLFDPESNAYVDARELGAPPVARLRELEATVEALERGADADHDAQRQWLTLLVDPGSSLGGSRPKATYMADDGSYWIAKFPSSEDRRDIGLLEHLVGQLALKAGIEMPPMTQFAFSSRGHTFAVKRFDRDGASRRVYASAMTVLQRRDGEVGSYLDLVQAIEQYGVPGHIEADLEQLYRRILFSIWIANRDDHLRNHGFLRSPAGWRLSPAFDINPNPDKADHALTIDGEDPRPISANLRACAEYFRLTDAAIARIDGEVREAIGSWPAVAKTLGATRGDQQVLATMIDVER